MKSTAFLWHQWWLLIVFEIGNSQLSNCQDPKAISLQCLRPGYVYHPDAYTTCTCKGLLKAECKPNGNSSSTTTTTTEKPQEPQKFAMHPLDPLTADEISGTKEIILNNYSMQKTENKLQFNIIVLKEPKKSLLLPYFLKGEGIPRSVYQRKSFSVLVETNTGILHEVVVNLDEKVIESWGQVADGLKPLLTPDDDALANSITKDNDTVKARCALLGFPDMNLVYTATWPVGYIADRVEYSGFKRPFEIFMYGLNSDDDNGYAHPMPFVVIIDLVLAKVIAIEDLPTHESYDQGSDKTGNVVPRNSANYDYNLRGPDFLRKDDKPIKVSQPGGPSFTIKGNELSWQKFKMHIGFNAREGIYINHIVYNDTGTIRPIMYRASLAEMAVYYGDPRPPYHRKYGFDEGELGLGYRANELKTQEDCIGSPKFITTVVNNNNGVPILLRNAICIVEEDAGILWKHVNFRTGRAITVRSRRLSIGMTATMGNYDYVVKWQFYQDASIQFYVQLTGILSSNMLAIGSDTGGFGTRVFPQVNAQYHQHLFALRLDTEIDGNSNSVHISEAVSLNSSQRNPYGNGITIQKTPLKTQAEGRGKIDPLTGRVWIITNDGKNHTYTGNPVGWKLMPAQEAKVMMKEDSPLRPKFGYLEYDVWVTKYEENQLFAGGFYLNNSGLPHWVSENPKKSIENKDIVLWHTFNPIHIPRVEDFPVMPQESREVWFKPYNFFLENPALDVPPTEKRNRRNEL